MAVFISNTVAFAEPPPKLDKPVPLFDGQTLAGWEGNSKLWRVEGGAITGGSLSETLKHNDFLASTREFTNFIVRFQIKLTGTEGFVNSGFQIRSQRVPKSSEMAGYQCDYGEPNWYASIYDESRRNKVMAWSNMENLRSVLRRNDWNEYVIRADGSRITTWINGVLGVDFYEPDLTLANYDWGKIGIQIHSGGKALVQVKDISIEELPAHTKFIGAPEPNAHEKTSPLTAEEELQTFTLPPGFEIELVASEDLETGFGKFVAIAWDLQGRLWTMTALEYPVDANESPEFARELYASRAKDKVLVYDRDPKSPTGYAARPRVFADGLAIPLGILPYQNGVYVQHGTEIVFLSDTDGDGKADKRDVILSGFGVQDSHLFPHQFTRAPGDWIWLAQGAFNYGKVKTTTGKQQQFDQTRMAKFRCDGSDFDITSQGPCNIWGLVLDGNGQAWIQEANDYGYPMMPFHESANYPGCSNPQMKSYAPEFPPSAPDFSMGGTGLSGLALSDASAWPEPYSGVFYVANPITRKVQAIHVTPDGPRFRYQKQPDFLLSSDEWFRPVALQVGPDGGLYIVDWYNKIISHNEVPRNHPERDKKRGRIWRVKHRDQKLFDVPDFTRLSGAELLAKLGGAPLAQSHMAWQAITDRKMTEIVPELKNLVGESSLPANRRIAALWALEGLRQTDEVLLNPLFRDGDRNIRREGLRALTETSFANVTHFKFLADDSDPEVRAQVVRSAGLVLSSILTSESAEISANAVEAFDLLLKLARPSLDGPTMKSTSNGRMIKAREAYDREFERYLVRQILEFYPGPLAIYLGSDNAKSLSVESRLLASLALEPRTSAALVARLLPQLNRPVGEEELLRLAQFPDEPGVSESLQSLLRNPATRTSVLESLLNVRVRFDAAKLAPLFSETAQLLLSETSLSAIELGVKLASSFQLSAVEPDLVRALEDEQTSRPRLALAALRALRELKSDRVELFVRIAETNDPSLQDAAVAALGASRNPDGPQELARLFPSLTPGLRRTALAGLSSTTTGGAALVKAIQSGAIRKDDLDGAIFDKLETLLRDDVELSAALKEMTANFRSALRLDGSANAWAETDLTLEGPFTVETWVKLDGGIDNNDGILGAPGVCDMNFHGGKLRVWIAGLGDVVIAQKSVAADAWTHLAVTRDATGKFSIYRNGELDSKDSLLAPQKFEKLQIGRTQAGKGTAGWLTEFRVWNRQRTVEEIRENFDRSFDDATQPDALIFRAGETDSWGKLQTGARLSRTSDFPNLLTSAQSNELAAKFAKYRTLAHQAGNVAAGESVFASLCINCHSVGGKGGQIGPVLNGAGALGVEALLRNILTPNAAMEPGYRTFRVELKDGEIVDGLLVSQDKDSIVLRRQSVPDLRIPQNAVKRAKFTQLSLMPDGLLEGLTPDEISALFAYLNTLE